MDATQPRQINGQSKVFLPKSSSKQLFELHCISGLLKGAGLTIYCARIPTQINLANLNLEFPLSIMESWFEGGINIEGLSTNFNINFGQSRIDKKLIAKSLEVGGDLLLLSTTLNNVDISYGNIDGNIRLDTSTITDLLYAESVKLGGYFYPSDSKTKTVNIVSAKIGRHLIISDSEINGQLDISSATVNGMLNLGSVKELPNKWGKDAVISPAPYDRQPFCPWFLAFPQVAAPPAHPVAVPGRQ